MTDNTQELYEILEDLVRDSQEDVSDFKLNSLPHELIGKNGAKQAIIDWHNKQTEELLDRLESKSSEWSVAAAELLDHLEDRNLEYIPLSAIEAERNKLKERGDE